MQIIHSFHNKKRSSKITHRFHKNENLFGAAPNLSVNLATEINKANYYPDSKCEELINKLAKHHQVDSCNILCGNGVDELLLISYIAFLNADTTFISTESTFPSYYRGAILMKVPTVLVPMINYQIPVDHIVKSSQQHSFSVIYICNPHNPTGTIIKKNYIKRFFFTCDDKHTVTIFDEAYAEYADESFVSAIDYIRQGKRVLVLRTFSKAYGLAGLRIGYVIGHRDLISQLQNVKSLIPFSVNFLAQLSAVTAMKDQPYLESTCKKNNLGREYFYSEMEKIKISYVKSQTNFILIKTPFNSAEFSKKLLQNYGIAVLDAALFGYPQHIRVTIGSIEEVKAISKAIFELIQQTDSMLL